MEPDPKSLPRHVAIIMDGNGRWAEGRGLPRVRGHEAGTASIREITEECAHLGIERLTLYSFSIENWRRPRGEVLFLMRLLKNYLASERETLLKNNVRLTSIGRVEDLPGPALRELRRSIELSAANNGLNLCLALSYGGRAEIADACRSIAEDVRAGKLRLADVDEKLVAARLYQPGPDPDLVIRTAGEMRVSNFLLWQISYSEIVISTVCWPDFRVPQFHETLCEYARRTRKFGGLILKSEDRSSAATAL
ncbi:MAG: di-trans,poly-cis-decaprenylcistransferase [Planctomycetes bacterium]|nr:di-trans,poly-cis-decaprenylcistransferase [Planctomycetota bacterium]